MPGTPDLRPSLPDDEDVINHFSARAKMPKGHKRRTLFLTGHCPILVAGPPSPVGGCVAVRQWGLADPGLPPLLGTILPHPAAYCGATNLHAVNDLHHTQALIDDHPCNVQFKCGFVMLVCLIHYLRASLDE
ncbi:MAG: hypothetical protein HOO87_16925 [Methyloglobulus sp.]|nr:hypothetical protein [Methyloglobulus sp.]